MPVTIQFILLPTFFVLWCLAMFRNVLYQCIQRMVNQATASDAPDAATLPPMSIIVTAHEQCNELRQYLPAILEQEYPQPYEVLVVDMNSTDDSRMFLESMASRYPHLHIVQLPETARNVSPIRLALTLAIRAASHEWLVITQANCEPASPQWLVRMGQQCASAKDAQIVVGFTRFRRGQGWNGLRCRFFRTWQHILQLPYILRHGAYSADGTNLCYRRSFFFGHRGFGEDVNLLVGATEIMVNHNSTPTNTVTCLHPDAFMLQDSPQYSKWWHRERLFFMETRSHFRHRLPYRLKYFSHVCLTEAFTLCILATLLVEVFLFEAYIIASVVFVLWLIHAICRAIYYNRALTALGESRITLALPLLFHAIPWWDTTVWLQRLFMKKQVFQKKFI